MDDRIGDPKFSRPCRFTVGCDGGGVGRGRRCMDEYNVMGCEMDGAADLIAASRQSDIFDLEGGWVSVLVQ